MAVPFHQRPPGMPTVKQSWVYNSEEVTHYKRVGRGEGPGSRVCSGLGAVMSGSQGSSMIAHLNLIPEGGRNMDKAVRVKNKIKKRPSLIVAKRGLFSIVEYLWFTW